MLEQPLAQSKQQFALVIFPPVVLCVPAEGSGPILGASSLSHPGAFELLVGRAHPFSTSAVSSLPQGTVVLPGLAQRRAEEMHLELSHETAAINGR